MSRIPPAPARVPGTIPIQTPPHRFTLENRQTIMFSFEALELTEYFNLTGTCHNWAGDMLNMCKEVSKHTVKELSSGSLRTLRFHSLEGAPCPEKLPNGVELKDMHQLRIGKSKGGIHGVLVENLFFVIWLDPLHNMYPNDMYGGLRKIKPASTCCMERDNEIQLLQERVQNLETDLEEAQQLVQLYSEDIAKYKSGQLD